MKRPLHALLVIIGNIPLLIAYACITAAMWLYRLADWVQPGATHGNCWSFVLPQVWKYGGFAAIRPVKGAKLAWGIGTPLHACWVPRLHGHVEQTNPAERYRGPSLLWRWMYFRFSVRGADTGPPRPWSESARGPL